MYQQIRGSRCAILDVVAVVLLAGVVGCNHHGSNNSFVRRPTATPTPTSSSSNSPTPTSTATATASTTATRTATATPTATASGTATATPTHTATPTATATAVPIAKDSVLIESTCNHQVQVFAPGAVGNVAPLAPGSDLCGGQAAAYDSQGNLYVLALSGPINTAINEYAAGSDGNAAPIASIAGPHTNLAAPAGSGAPTSIAVDSSGVIYVTKVNNNVNPVASSVLEFAAGSSGDAAPIATITGAALGEAVDVAVDGSGNIFVDNVSSSGTSGSDGSVVEYPPGSNGNATPSHTISGSNTDLVFPNAIAIDAAGTIYAVNEADPSVVGSKPSITEYSRGASGNTAPHTIIQGSSTTLSFPHKIALDSGANIFLANTGAAAIVKYAAGASGNAAPIATIAGANTHVTLPFSIAIEQGNGELAEVNPVLLTEIPIFAAGASGNVAPTRLITPASLGLANSGGVAVDPSGKIYVSDGAGHNGGSIVVYAAGSGANAVPSAVIEGANTGLDNPFQLAVTSTTIYAANCNSNAVTEYLVTDSGNAAPAVTIAGRNTGLSCPAGIAVDATGNIYVSNSNTGSVAEFAAVATGNVAPINTISGSNTGIGFPLGIALDSGGKLYVTSYNTNPPAILVFASGASGNVAPVQTIQGPTTGFITGFPTYLAVDSAGNLYANGNNDGVQIFAPGANGDVAPTATIGGPLTQVSGPAGIALAP